MDTLPLQARIINTELVSNLSLIASIILPKSVTILYFLATCPSKKSVNEAITNSTPTSIYFKSITIFPFSIYVGNSKPTWSKGNSIIVIIINDIIILLIVILFALFILSPYTICNVFITKVIAFIVTY